MSKRANKATRYDSRQENPPPRPEPPPAPVDLQYVRLRETFAYHDKLAAEHGMRAEYVFTVNTDLHKYLQRNINGFPPHITVKHDAQLRPGYTHCEMQTFPLEETEEPCASA